MKPGILSKYSAKISLQSELISPIEPANNQSVKLLRLSGGTSGRMRETELQGQISSRIVFKKGLTQRRMALLVRKPAVARGD